MQIVEAILLHNGQYFSFPLLGEKLICDLPTVSGCNYQAVRQSGLHSPDLIEAVVACGSAGLLNSEIFARQKTIFKVKILKYKKI